MPALSVIHDTPVTILDIFTEVQTNLFEAGLRWFSADDINASIQDQYNKLVALLNPIEKCTLIPQLASPYYPIGVWVKDYMYLSGLFNPSTNLWLEGMTFKNFKAIYQTYLAVGMPRHFSIMDFNWLLIWPFLQSIVPSVIPNNGYPFGQGPSQGGPYLPFGPGYPSDSGDYSPSEYDQGGIGYTGSSAPYANGVLMMLYKAKAPLISNAHIPLFPYSVAKQLLEYSTTADLMEQAREFTKAARWWSKLFNVDPKGKVVKSVFDQARSEIKNLAKADRELVLEPYRWIFHGGTFSQVNWINAETPGGTIDGSNTVFTLAQVPNPSSSLMLFRNGILVFAGTGYNLNGQTVTYETDYIPQTGDIHEAWYQVA